MGTESQDRQTAAGAAINTRWTAALAAARELLAWSDALSSAYAAGLAAGESRAAAAEALGRERAARELGYAEAVADMKRAEAGIASAWREQAEAEAGRWVVRGEFRARATFGEPHPGDYRGGPVAWPELPESEPQPTHAVGNARVEAAA